MFTDEVPKSFIGRRYTADSDVSLLDREGHQTILRFGTSGFSDAIGLDLATGNVIEILTVADFAPVFVNKSTEKFTLTVKAVIDRFPYYGQDATDEEIQDVARELRDIIKHIDSEATVPDRYWSTFIDDVEIGDLSTEAILAIGG